MHWACLGGGVRGLPVVNTGGVVAGGAQLEQVGADAHDRQAGIHRKPAVAAQT